MKLFLDTKRRRNIILPFERSECFPLGLMQPKSLRCFVVHFQNLLTVIVAASFANTVRKNVFAAVGAFNHAGHIELPNAGTSQMLSLFRDLFLRCDHCGHLLFPMSNYKLNCCSRNPRRSDFCRRTDKGPSNLPYRESAKEWQEPTHRRRFFPNRSSRLRPKRNHLPTTPT